jgi:hypothetical protein
MPRAVRGAKVSQQRLIARAVRGAKYIEVRNTLNGTFLTPQPIAHDLHVVPGRALQAGIAQQRRRMVGDADRHSQ